MMGVLLLKCCGHRQARNACLPRQLQRWVLRGPCMRSTPDITPHLGTLLNFRRDLHANPELKYEEHRTGDKVAAYLTALGLPSESIAPAYMARYEAWRAGR